MLFIHDTACISAQQTFSGLNLDQLRPSIQNKMYAVEPPYLDIPPGLLRRMGKAVRMAVGAVLPLVRSQAGLQGILAGTANGGMEDCIKFLNQIIEYDEGVLAPGNFVSSTANAIAAQIGLLTRNKQYNITHVHRGLSFENAALDASMLCDDQPRNSYLLGAVDEISTFNYNIDRLDGWYKETAVSNNTLYGSNSPGSMAGEGAAFFIVNGKKESAKGRLQAINFFHTRSVSDMNQQLRAFLASVASAGQTIDLLLTGENGDSRLQKYYDSCEALFDAPVSVARFKHMTGEFPTASSLALWIALQILQQQHVPDHMFKKQVNKAEIRNILIYNNFKDLQHSLMLVSLP